MATSSVPVYDDSSIKKMGALEHIRAKKGMYIGDGGVHAWYQVIKEIVDNAADEALDKNKIYEINVKIFTDGNRCQICVIDHARGIPLNRLKTVYTDTNVSGKFENAYNGISTGTFGIGSTVTTALSRHFLAFSKRADGFAGLYVKDSLVQEYNVFPPIDEDLSTVGTTVVFEPDSELLDATGKDFLDSPEGMSEVYRLITHICLFRHNVRCTIERIEHIIQDAWFRKKTFLEQWRYLQGIGGDVIYSTPSDMDPFEFSKAQFQITAHSVWTFKDHKDINVNDDNDIVGYDIALGLSETNPDKNSGVLGCVNYNVISTWKASHMSVVQDQFKSFLVTYIDEDDNDLKSFFLNTYIIPFHGYISASGKNLDFSNQTKSNFIDSRWAKVFSTILHASLEKLDSNVFERLFDCILEDLTKKFNASINRALSTGKSLKNVAFDLKRSDSYFACETKDKTRAMLAIVEGLSSGNWITQLRDPSYQAVYELRGKCINTFTSSKEQCQKDDVFSDLVRLIGVHPRDTNLDNMNFKEICVMADADPDGLSIIDLLIGMFYTINPLILEEGRVTIAMPPLYVLATKDKTRFLRDQHALDDAKVVVYEAHLKIGVAVNGGEIAYLKGDTYRDVVYMVKHICSVIEEVSRKLAIDPFLVEEMCHCVDYIYPGHVNTEAIKYILRLDDCIYSRTSEVITLIKSRMEVSIPINKLMNEIRIYILPELEKVKWNNITLFVTTKQTDYFKDAPVMFWQLRQLFDTFDKEFSIRRIKGLGECTASELKYTCLDPRTRTVVTIRGIGDVKTLHDMLGVDTAERKKLVVSDMNSEWTRGEM